MTIWKGWCLNTAFLTTLLCGNTNAENVSQRPFPLPKPDVSRVEQVRTSATLWIGRQMRHAVTPCSDTVSKGPPIANVPWPYLRCRFETVSGSSSVIQIWQETEIPYAFDGFRSIDLVIEVAGSLETKHIELPNQSVRLFFHNCRHSWNEVSGCLAGTSARGHMHYQKVDTVSGILTLDVLLKGDPNFPLSPIGRYADAVDTLRFTTRIPVGTPLDPNIK